MEKFARWVKCRFWGHEFTSYSDEINGDEEKYKVVVKRLDMDHLSAFYEVCALRCKHCDYTYKAKTKTNWDLLKD